MTVEPEPRDKDPQIDWERQKLASSYVHVRRKVLVVDTLLGLAYILAWLVSGASVGWSALLDALGGRLFAVAGYFVVFYLAYSAILLPVSYYGGYRVSRRFGLSTQSPLGWLIDWLKSLGITLVLGLILIEVLYFTIASYPSWWWLIMGAVLVLFTVVLSNLGPILLVPLFYRLSPIEDKKLADKLVRLSERAGTRVRGVYRMNLSSKTTAANAALMGLGNTRRIVLGDTLLDNYTDDEIETIYAHELGHHVHADIPVLIAVQSITTLAGFYIASLLLDRATAIFGIGSIADVASLPLFALTFGVLGTAWMPMVNGISRWLEHRADVYAIEITGKARAFRNSMVRLCNQNLAELHPNKWVVFFLYDHPPIGSRIQLGEDFTRSRD